MNNEHYYNVEVLVLNDVHKVRLGQLSLNTTIREVADRVLDIKRLEGLQNLCLGYLTPSQIIIYLPPETTLSEAKSYIMRVSYALYYGRRASTVSKLRSPETPWVSVLHVLS